MGKGRLLDMHSFRRPREVKFFGNGEEVVQMAWVGLAMCVKPVEIDDSIVVAQVGHDRLNQKERRLEGNANDGRCADGCTLDYVERCRVVKGIRSTVTTACGQETQLVE
jgi:hypothetical protein